MANYKFRDYMRGTIQFGDDVLLYELISVILYVGKDTIWNIIISTKLQSKNWNELQHLILEYVENSSNKEALNNILNDIGRHMSFDIAIRSIEAINKISEEELRAFFFDYSEAFHTRENFYCADIPVVNELVVSFFKLYKGETLLNTLCGSGNFLLEASSEKLAKEYVGIDAEKRVSDIAYLRGNMFDRNISVQCNNLFSIQNQKYDMIYATYPFKIQYELQEIVPRFYSLPLADNIELKKYSASMLNLLFLTKQLTANGILIALVPEGGVFNSLDKNIREYIVNYNYLDAVISLPNNMLRPFFAGIKTSLLILKANREPDDKIKMIDATEFGSMARKSLTLAKDDIKQIVSLYSDNKNNICKAMVSRTEIAKEDYYLGVQRYVSQGGILINGTELGKMCTNIFRGYQINAQNLDNIITDNPEITPYRIINISDLTNEGFIVDELTPVVIEDISKVQKFLLEDGDIVLTAKNTTIKCAVYEQKNNIKTILSGNLIAIRTNKKVLNPFYLKTFLDSETGKAQLSSIQTGTSIKTITPKNLEKMEVSLLPKTDQDELATKYVKKIGEVKELINKYVSVMNEIEHIYDESIEIIPN